MFAPCATAQRFLANWRPRRGFFPQTPAAAFRATRETPCRAAAVRWAAGGATCQAAAARVASRRAARTHGQPIGSSHTTRLTISRRPTGILERAYRAPTEPIQRYATRMTFVGSWAGSRLPDSRERRVPTRFGQW